MHCWLSYTSPRKHLVGRFSRPPTHFPLMLTISCDSVCCSDQFVELFVKATNAPKVGDPLDEEVFQGAQANKRQFDTILSYIAAGKEAGAKVETGGERIGSKGFFIQPTVFSNVSLDMKIAKEEIFGRLNSDYTAPFWILPC